MNRRLVRLFLPDRCWLRLLIGVAVSGVLGASVPGQETGGIAEPRLYRKIEIPRQLLQRASSDGHLYGGDVRMGDLTGNGQVDFVVFRSSRPGIKTCFLGAFTLEGRYLWHVGEGGEQPTRPGSVTIYDLDADGRSEVICLFIDRSKSAPTDSFANITVQLRNGATGEVEKQSAPPELTTWSTNKAGGHGNWAHQRIVIANLRGKPTPQDFVIKLGFTYIAFDHHLKVLWTCKVPEHNRFEHCSYTPAVGDVDDDGKDEVYGGHVLIDDDGTVLWYEIKAHHLDSVAVLPWDEGRVRLIASGYGQVLDAAGNPVVRLGPQAVPHGQEVRVANFTNEQPGPEMIIRYNGHNPDVMLVACDGRILRRFRLHRQPNNTGMEAVYWHGFDRPALLCYGGKLWNASGQPSASLPELPPLVGPTEANRTMAWYHIIPANVCGDDREEVVLFNPWDRFVLIYTPAPLRKQAFRGYLPGPRQYNVRLMD